MNTAKIRQDSIDVALEALNCHVNGDRIEAARMIMNHVEETGYMGIIFLLTTWLDTILLVTGKTPDKNKPKKLSWVSETGDHFDEADDVPEDSRWAGRMLSARYAEDSEMFLDLIESIPPEHGGRYLQTVLESASLTVQIMSCIRREDHE